MGKGIDSYFAKFPNLPNPIELRRKQQGVTALSGTLPAGAITVLHHMPEDSPQFAYIGRISVEWANLEALIDETIWRACRISPNIGACLTAQLIGPAPRLNALIGIFAELKMPHEFIEAVVEFKIHALA